MTHTDTCVKLIKQNEWHFCGCECHQKTNKPEESEYERGYEDGLKEQARIEKLGVEEIRAETKAEVIQKIREWGKRSQQKWVKCEEKNCNNKVECKRANHYIETIWDKHF